MRLIRCTSTDPTGLIDNNFNQDIIITPKSKIAVKSLSLETQEGSIVIDASNDNIEFQIDTLQGGISATLEHGEYEPNNIPSLLTNITNELNKELDADISSNIGMEIECDVNGKTKTEIAFRRGILAENNASIVVDKGAFDVEETGDEPNTVFAGQGTTNPNDCFMYDPTPMCRGAGVFRLQINRLGAVVDNFTMALTTVNPNTTSGNTFDQNNIDYGIHCNTTADDYEYINFGVVTPPDNIVTPTFVGVGNAGNDFLQIEINQGSIIGSVYKVATDTFTILFQEDYNVGGVFPLTNLFPVVIFHSDSVTTAVGKFRYTHSPFLSDTYLKTQPIKEAIVGATPPDQELQATEHFLEFGGQSLASFLGFTSARTPRIGTTLTNNFSAIGQNIFRPNNKSDAWIVELLNIGLTSYDGATSQRKSYLAVIPRDDNNNQVIFSEQYPVFIDIDNAQPLSIRNLKLRILNNDGSAVASRGLITLVLLIENGEEKRFDIRE